MKFSLLDLGLGNLHSLAKAFASAAPRASVSVTGDPREALTADLLVLPGVGSWAALDLGPHRERLREALEFGAPCVGVCLGMQMLFESSEEGSGEGVGFFGGAVTKLRSLRAPHMGWSRVEAVQGADLEPPRFAYYAHSYACRPRDASSVLATTAIEGDAFAAVVAKKNTVGCQFHPEKSSAAGIDFLARVLVRVLS